MSLRASKIFFVHKGEHCWPGKKFWRREVKNRNGDKSIPDRPWANSGNREENVFAI